MPSRRPVRTMVSAYPTLKKTTRITIPQSEQRVLQMEQKDVLRPDALRPPDPKWFTGRRQLRRPLYGVDPREARAVPDSMIRGTLPERILFKYLTEVMKFVYGVDFGFQTSMEGGRLEMGGLVVDFNFESMKIVMQVQGPTHSRFLQGKKDEEQKEILAEFGYTVIDIEEEIIYDEYRFENEMRRIFNLYRSGGGGSALSGAMSPQSVPASSGSDYGIPMASPEGNDNYTTPDRIKVLLIECLERSSTL